MADKNSVTVLKDGQLAVAMVAQNGEIISEPSAISTTVLVQTEQGPQLAVPMVDLNGGGGGGYVLPAATAETLGGVKVGEGLSVTEDGTLSAQGGGGSVPTLTWLTGNVGNTLDTDIADLQTKPLVKVYKNGELLQQGTTDTGVWYVGGASKSVNLTNPAPLTAASSWEFQTKIQWKNGGSGNPTIIGYTGTNDQETPVLLKEGSYLGMYLSSNGSSWNIATPSGSSFIPQDGTIYEIKMGFSGTNYYLKAKEEGASDFTTYQDVTSSTKVNCTVPFMLLNCGYSSNYYTLSSMCIDETKIIIDGEVWFDGSKQTVQRYTNPLLKANGTAGGSSYACYASIESGSYQAWKAFDGDTTTSENCWYSGYNPSYPIDITYYYPTAINPDSLSITNEVATPCNIKEAVIQGSNDGTNFDDLSSITNVNVDGQTTTFPISTANKYKYIRLHILSTYGYQGNPTEGSSIQEITIHSTDGVEEETYENNGCTETSFISNDYAISGENVIFNTALIVTDKICVETY